MRKRKKGPSRGKRIVAVCSPQRGSGVTLTALALACALSEECSVCFAEAGKPYVFDACGMAKTFLLSGFTDYYQLFADGKPFPGPANLWPAALPPSTICGGTASSSASPARA